MSFFKYLTLLVLLFSGNLFGQNNVWLLGNKSAPSPTSSYTVSFTGGFPIVSETNNDMGFYESNSVVSDENGNILMYSDGIKIYDGGHQLMQAAPTNLKGTNAGSVSGSTQGSISVGTSSNPDIINFFTAASDGSSNGLRVHRIDLSKAGNGTANNLLGEVISYDSLLFQNTSEILTAFGTCNSDSVWVVGHEKESYNFIVILVTGNGVQSVTTQSVSTPNNFNSGFAGSNTGRGSLKFNSDGTKIVMTGYYPIGSHILDFDKNTGTLTNPINITYNQTSDINGYGVEFSPDDTKIYFAGATGVHQHDLLTNSTVLMDGSSNKFAGIEKGKDGKLYLGKNTVNRDSYLGVIENPNQTVTNGANYIDEGLFVGEYVTFCIPHDVYCVSIKDNCKNFEITNQPIAQEQCKQESFSLSANAANYDNIKWKKQGSNTVYGKSLSYTNPSFSPGHAGLWYCEFSKAGCASILTNSVSISESEGCIYCDELVVTSQPTRSEVCPEDTLSLSAKASGYESIQWKKQGSNTVYGTSLNYVDTSFLPSDTGLWYCEFTKTGCPNITTDSVTVTENLLCNNCDEFYITTQPIDTKVCPGESFSLSINAEGYDSLAWRKVGSTDVYGTNLNFTYDNFTPSDAGEWYCELFRTLCTSISTNTVQIKESKACTTPNCFVEQQTNNVWLLGKKEVSNKTSSYTVDFSSGSPVVSETNNDIGFYESTSVVSDENGNVLMYSDGIKIYDGNHTLMAGAPNSLKGTVANSLASSAQGALSIGTATNPDRINFFTSASYDGPSNGLRVHTVDLSNQGNGSVNNPLGEVVSYDSLLWQNTNEMLTAYGTCNSDTVWVVGHERNSYNFIIILVTGDGVESVTTQSVATPNKWNNGISIANSGKGGLEFNAAGTKLVMTGGYPIGTHILDFDKYTGVLSNPSIIPDHQSLEINGYGLEFSPDDTKLYITSERGGFYQHDLLTGTTVLIDATGFKYAGIEKGRDGKLYLGKWSESLESYLGVVENPNQTIASGANYIDEGLFVGEHVSFFIPQDIYWVTNRNSCQGLEVISQPSAQEQCKGEPFTLNADASNYETIKWKKQGSSEVYGTELSYTNNNFALSDTGLWYCEFGKSGCASVVTNAVSVSESAGCIYCDELFVTSQPIGSTVCPEDTLSLSTNASGYESLQWKRNGSNIVYGTSLDYMDTNFSPSDKGIWYCEFTKTGCPNITTDSVIVTESLLCNNCDEFYITTQPTGSKICPGESFSISANATGYDSLAWKKVGSSSVYGTSLTFTNNNFAPSDAGYWYCEFYRTLCPSKSTKNTRIEERRACVEPNCEIEQKANNVWLVGGDPEANSASYTIDFTSGTPNISTTPTPGFDEFEFYESNSVVSDENGTILMYSDGFKIYDGSHNLMKGGPSYAEGLKGTGRPASSVQGALSVGMATNPDMINFFTAASVDGNSANGLRVHIVDLVKKGNGTAENPLGEIVSYDSLLWSNTTEMLTAFGTCSSDTAWVVGHEKGSANFIVVSVEGDGVQSVTLQNVPTQNIGNTGYGRGSIKFNSTGTKLVMTGSYPVGTNIFDFDKETGLISNPVNILNAQLQQIDGYGVEFSPDDTKLYISNNNGLFQHDLNTSSTFTLDSEQQYLGQIEMGPDGKLYVGKWFQTQESYLGVIENPNKTLSNGANYTHEGLFVGSNVSYGLPQDIYWVNPIGGVITSTQNEEFNLSNGSLFPNPTSGILNNPQNHELMIFDYQGKLVLKGNQASLDISSINDGVYFVRHKAKPGTFNTSRIILIK